MPRGQPDFGMYQQKTVGATLSDMGDLAVRLGSIVEYDRRGDIVSLDDFENTILKWTDAATGVGYVILDSTTAKSGSQAINLHTDVGGAATATLAKRLTRLGVPRLGIEISFSDMDLGCDFYFTISYWDGVTGYRARLWFDQSTHNLYVEGLPAIGWVLVANVGFLRRGEYLWYPVKLVVDFVNHYYVRVLYSDTEYSVATIALPTFGDAGGSYILAQFQLLNVVAANHNVWVDDFILTQNEP